MGARNDYRHKFVERLNHPHFMALANCKGHDPMIFFPAPHESEREAINICRQCPVRNTCLEYALKYNEVGIWGGTSGRQRQKLRAARRKTAALTLAQETREDRSHGSDAQQQLCPSAAST